LRVARAIPIPVSGLPPAEATAGATLMSRGALMPAAAMNERQGARVSSPHVTRAPARCVSCAVAAAMISASVMTAAPVAASVMAAAMSTPVTRGVGGSDRHRQHGRDGRDDPEHWRPH
jgi:hypothetical protein